MIPMIISDQFGTVQNLFYGSADLTSKSVLYDNWKYESPHECKASERDVNSGYHWKGTFFATWYNKLALGVECGIWSR